MSVPLKDFSLDINDAKSRNVTRHADGHLEMRVFITLLKPHTERLL
jgi:hypothetical protein